MQRRQSLQRQPEDCVSQWKTLRRLRVARLQAESAVCQRRLRGWKVQFQVQLQLMAGRMQAWVWGQLQLLRLPLNEAL